MRFRLALSGNSPAFSKLINRECESPSSPISKPLVISGSVGFRFVFFFSYRTCFSITISWTLRYRPP